MVRSFCFAIAVLAISSAAWAENSQPGSHSAAEERACRGDAHRYCKDDLADEFRVASCLQEHRDHISHACRAVIDGHGM
jgi:Cysteine rich repeat